MRELLGNFNKTLLWHFKIDKDYIANNELECVTCILQRGYAILCDFNRTCTEAIRIRRITSEWPKRRVLKEMSVTCNCYSRLQIPVIFCRKLYFNVIP